MLAKRSDSIDFYTDTSDRPVRPEHKPNRRRILIPFSLILIAGLIVGVVVVVINFRRDDDEASKPDVDMKPRNDLLKFYSQTDGLNIKISSLDDITSNVLDNVTALEQFISTKSINILSLSLHFREGVVYVGVRNTSLLSKTIERLQSIKDGNAVGLYLTYSSTATYDISQAVAATLSIAEASKLKSPLILAISDKYASPGLLKNISVQSPSAIVAIEMQQAASNESIQSWTKEQSNLLLQGAPKDLLAIRPYFDGGSFLCSLPTNCATAKELLQEDDLITARYVFSPNQLFFLPTAQSPDCYSKFKSMLRTLDSPVNFFSLPQRDTMLVTWEHRVNSKQHLDQVLTGDKMMIESDILMGTVIGSPNDSTPIPIMAHPPNSTSDLSFKDYLTTVQKAKKKKGIKLDFKEATAFIEGMKIVKAVDEATPFHQPIWVNADIVQGPGGGTPKYNESELRTITGSINDNFPYVTLSYGWTTGWKNNSTLDRPYIDKDLTTLTDRLSAVGSPPQPITIPLRAAQFLGSWDMFREFLQKNERFTLTIWTGKTDTVNATKLADIRRETLTMNSGKIPMKLRIYYDLYDSLNGEFEEALKRSNRY